MSAGGKLIVTGVVNAGSAPTRNNTRLLFGPEGGTICGVGRGGASSFWSGGHSSGVWSGDFANTCSVWTSGDAAAQACAVAGRPRETIEAEWKAAKLASG